MGSGAMSLATVTTQISQLPSQSGSARLQQLVAAKLTDDRLGVVVDKLLSKAETGDTKALDYLLTIGGMKPGVPQQVVINNFYEGESSPTFERVIPATGAQPATPWQQITTYLSVAGPSTAHVIADQVQLPVEQVIKILDGHPERFDVVGTTYSLKGQR